MSANIGVGVIGVGALGKEHARLYAELARRGEATLVGVHDVNADAAQQVAERCGTRVFRTFDEAVSACEAFSLVTPTSTHFDLARKLISQGKHVLVEKPMTDKAAQAAELVQLARAGNCVLQVGHVERFNPVFKYLETAVKQPRFIESHRLSPYPARSTDVGVVLDLMIHDLDLVLAFVKSAIATIDAVGVPVLSRSEDIANARLRFANGCVANLTASRVSAERLRKIRVFSGGANPCYVSLDYRAQEGYLYRVAREDEPESSLARKLFGGREAVLVSRFGGRRIVREPVPIAKDEPLKLELQSFLNCVRDHRLPVVSGEAGARALDVALEITRQIQAHSELTPDVEWNK